MGGLLRFGHTGLDAFLPQRGVGDGELVVADLRSGFQTEKAYLDALGMGVSNAARSVGRPVAVLCATRPPARMTDMLTMQNLSRDEGILIDGRRPVASLLAALYAHQLTTPLAMVVVDELESLGSPAPPRGFTAEQLLAARAATLGSFAAMAGVPVVIGCRSLAGTATARAG